MDLELPDEVRALQDTAREFAWRELHSVEIALDRDPEHSRAFAAPAYREAMARSHELGLHRMPISEEGGGLGLGLAAQLVVLEELASAAPGLASRLLVAPIPALFIDRFGLADRHPRLKEYLTDFVADTTGERSGAWAITEPEVGSDIFTFDDPTIGFATSAVRAAPARDGYRLDGAKSAFVSNGHLADCFLVMANLDGNEGMQGTAVFLVPADEAGVSRGRPLDKLGLRALNQAEVCFEGVLVPEEFLVCEPGPGYRLVLETIVMHGNAAVGAIALGVARTAYERALAYAKDRRQGGRPIIGHQIVATKLFCAQRDLAAARALLWRVGSLVDQGRFDLGAALAARSLACETCLRVTADAVQIQGGYGIARENLVEKLYRDARPLQIMDGTVERVALVGAALL